MGLLDQLAGQVLGSLGSGGASSTGNSQLIQIAGQLLQQQGGIAGLLEKFQQAGLGDQASSWVSTGENMPIDGAQLSQALGGNTLSDLAGKSGLSGEQMSAGLAQMLPQLINQMTPNGNTHGSEDLLSSVLGSFLSKA